MSKNENLSIKHVYNSTFIIVKNKGRANYVRPLLFLRFLPREIVYKHTNTNNVVYTI